MQVNLRKFLMLTLVSGTLLGLLIRHPGVTLGVLIWVWLLFFPLMGFYKKTTPKVYFLWLALYLFGFVFLYLCIILVSSMQANVW